jgi:hypothetical protein
MVLYREDYVLADFSYRTRTGRDSNGHSCSLSGRTGDVVYVQGLPCSALRVIIAGTGCGGFLDRWLFHLNTRMIVPGIEAIAVYTQEALRTLW